MFPAQNPATFSPATGFPSLASRNVLSAVLFYGLGIVDRLVIPWTQEVEAEKNLEFKPGLRI